MVDNAVDEHLTGHAGKITVCLLEDSGCEVTDDGRGFPVDKHPTEKLHGVGVSVVNALSSRTEVEVFRDGHRHTIAFARGVTSQGLKKGAKRKATGTTVRFWPDTEVFETTDIDHDTVAQRLRETALLNLGLEMVLIDNTSTTGTRWRSTSPSPGPTASTTIGSAATSTSCAPPTGAPTSKASAGR